MTNTIQCIERLQAAADRLATEGASRSCILKALMEVAVKIARDDPSDSGLIQLEDAAGLLLDTVHGHRRKQMNAWERKKKKT
jgi:hypothetical protein